MTKDFPWYIKYPKGVPHEVELNEYASVVDLFEDSCKKYGNREAVENMGKVLTFSQVDELSRNFAAYLQNTLGLQKGDRIAIQLPNILQFHVAFFGALRAGLIVVNTNPLYTPREMEHQFKDAGVVAIVIVANFARNLEQIIHHTKIKHVIVTELGDMLNPIKRTLVNFVVRRVKKMVPVYNLPGSISFLKAIKRGASLSYTKPPLNSNDIALLQYTGGTTGIAKGAQLSHSNIVCHNTIVRHWFKPVLNESQQDVVITAIPMYHIFALTVNGLLMMSTGMKSVLITNPRDMKGFVKELAKHKVSIFTGVNTLFNGLLNTPGFSDLDFSSLRISVGGAMPIQDVVAKRWKEVTKTDVIEGYGLSETSPVLCCNPLDGNHKSGTIGVPVPSTEIALFDDEGDPSKEGEAGEICARGPQVMRGYWEKDNEGVFFPGGWFRTGDIGVMDKDGFFKIVDRKKDMIKVSGFNVYPTEIENVLASHPGVLEVAAIGMPDEKSGEVIKAFVVKRDQSLTQEQIKDFCHQNLTNYKVPKYFEFRTELPKSNVGKILRRELRG